MKSFTCVCGNKLYFENSQCLACERALGYLPDLGILSALEPADEVQWRALHPAAAGQLYRQCGNYRYQQVCNWMVPVVDDDPFCVACRLNQVIPDLDAPNHRDYWYRIEVAKRRLLYTLYGLGLPVFGQQAAPDGLAFAFLADRTDHDEFSDRAGNGERILTGHADGLITINIAEADDIARTRMRTAMNEGYRTLLGHFRHEIGHYYWTLLIHDKQQHEAFRGLFGDERDDYGEALKRYYRDGAPSDWQDRFISAYASAHPWEDWAECWAHYLHMTDVLETAEDIGLRLGGRHLPSLLPRPGLTLSRKQFYKLLDQWMEVTQAMNALNRSLGLRDAYPFMLCAAVKEKLHFIHLHIGAARTNKSRT